MQIKIIHQYCFTAFPRIALLYPHDVAYVLFLYTCIFFFILNYMHCTVSCIIINSHTGCLHKISKVIPGRVCLLQTGLLLNKMSSMTKKKNTNLILKISQNATLIVFN